MSMDARDRMIDAFTNDPAVTVFLMSLKAGGVALNLTAASHVMLLDPWWCGFYPTPNLLLSLCCSRRAASGVKAGGPKAAGPAGAPAGANRSLA